MNAQLTGFQKNDIKTVLKDVGNFQRKEQKNIKKLKIDDKGLNQLVSAVDIKSEKMLVEKLAKITPNCSFITEENTISQSHGRLTWIIDPLDGTTNYLFGLNIYAISIALYLGKTPLYGGIYLPMFDDFYMADESGAYLNEKKIQVSKNKELSQTLLATGFPYYKFDELPEYLEILKYLMQHTRGLRRMGSAAIDLVYTAQGIFDGFFELNLSPWDVAAGAYIVKQAGGAVTSFTKNEDFIFGNSIVVGNMDIHSQLSKILKEKF